jgi:hypothetical protein
MTRDKQFIANSDVVRCGIAKRDDGMMKKLMKGRNGG